MFAGVGLGHQSLHVAPNELARGIAEQPLGRAVDRADRAPPIDHDDAIDGGINDRAIKRVGETRRNSSLRVRRCRIQIPDPLNVSSVEVRVGPEPANFSSYVLNTTDQLFGEPRCRIILTGHIGA